MLSVFCMAFCFCTQTSFAAEDNFASKYQAAKTKIETYANPADYRPAEAADLEKYVGAGVESLGIAKTTAQLDFVVNSTIGLIDKLKTNDKYIAEDMEALINSLGVITVQSGVKINEVNNAFNALTDNQKSLVNQDAKNKLAEANRKYQELTSGSQGGTTPEVNTGNEGQTTPGGNVAGGNTQAGNVTGGNIVVVRPGTDTTNQPQLNEENHGGSVVSGNENNTKPSEKTEDVLGLEYKNDKVSGINPIFIFLVVIVIVGIGAGVVFMKKRKIS